MDLAPNGIDCFYIDESERHPLAVASCVRIPFLRPKQSGGWEFVWNRYLDEVPIGDATYPQTILFAFARNYTATRFWGEKGSIITVGGTLRMRSCGAILGCPEDTDVATGSLDNVSLRDRQVRANGT
jgi:hypothetical protein